MKMQRWLRFAVLASICSMATGLVADDEKKASKDETKVDAEQVDEKDDADTLKKKVRFTVSGGKHWLGIRIAPVEDALKSQLGIKEGIIVQQIVPESPADKAGVQTHDILLSYNGKEIAAVGDLFKSVQEAGDKEAKLVVLRAGKETTLSVKPEDRPTDDKISTFVPEINAEDVKELFFSDKVKSEDGIEGKIVWRALGPGVVAQGLKVDAKALAFPKGLSVSISKENDEPAKIVAKKDGKTYETTEDKLSALPEDIRGHVERMLSTPRVTALAVPGGADAGVRLHVDGNKLMQLHKDTEGYRKMAEEHAARAKEMAREAQKAFHQHRVEIQKLDGRPFDDLRKEIEALRKEVHELKKSGKLGSDRDSSQQDSKESK